MLHQIFIYSDKVILAAGEKKHQKLPPIRLVPDHRTDQESTFKNHFIRSLHHFKHVC